MNGIIVRWFCPVTFYTERFRLCLIRKNFARISYLGSIIVHKVITKYKNLYSRVISVCQDLQEHILTIT